MFCPQYRPVGCFAERQAERLAPELVATGRQAIILTLRIDSHSPRVEARGGLRIDCFPLVDRSAAGRPPGLPWRTPHRVVLAGGAAGALVPVGDENSLYQIMHCVATDADYCFRYVPRRWRGCATHYTNNAVASQHFDLNQQLAVGPRPGHAASPGSLS